MIDNGSELVGNRVVEGAANAIHALSKMPQSETETAECGPTCINDADPVYKKLLLWRDANHNGVSDANELRPVSEVLTKIGLGYARFNLSDEHGNVFVFQGWMEVRTAPGLNRAAALTGDSEQQDATRQTLRGFLDKIIIPPGDGLLQVVGNLGEMLTAARVADHFCRHCAATRRVTKRWAELEQFARIRRN